MISGVAAQNDTFTLTNIAAINDLTIDGNTGDADTLAFSGAAGFTVKIGASGSTALTLSDSSDTNSGKLKNIEVISGVADKQNTFTINNINNDLKLSGGTAIDIYDVSKSLSHTLTIKDSTTDSDVADNLKIFGMTGTMTVNEEITELSFKYSGGSVSIYNGNQTTSQEIVKYTLGTTSETNDILKFEKSDNTTLASVKIKELVTAFSSNQNQQYTISLSALDGTGTVTLKNSIS